MSSLGAVIAADQAADLDRAVQLSSLLLTRGAGTSSLSQRVAGQLQLSRVLRHRGLGEDLHRCLDAATQALHLASLPTGDERLRDLATLSRASALLALGDGAGCLDLVAPFVAVDTWRDPATTAWAWRLLGATALQRSSIFEGIAALLNAAAEEQRLGQRHGSQCTLLLLLEAFSRAGHILDAQRVLELLPPGDLIPRRRILLHLGLAAHRHRYGEIDAALTEVEQAQQLIRSGSGLDRLQAGVHRVRARCLDDWRLAAEARQERRRAQQLAGPSPTRPASMTRTGGSDPSAARVLAEPITVTVLTHPHPSAVSVPELIEQFRGLLALEPEHARALERAVRDLQGVPGEERAEALALLEAGILLADGPAELQPWAERLLRRALARLDHLEGTGLWQAHCCCSLGLLLSETDPDEALELLVQALAGFGEQRHLMPRRSYRSTWGDAVEHRAVEAAIELAHRRGRDDLAADLIIFSRLAGVPTPQQQPSATRNLDRVPLAQLPRLHYIDGTASLLGRGSPCQLL